MKSPFSVAHPNSRTPTQAEIFTDFILTSLLQCFLTEYLSYKNVFFNWFYVYKGSTLFSDALEAITVLPLVIQSKSLLTEQREAMHLFITYVKSNISCKIINKYLQQVASRDQELNH